MAEPFEEVLKAFLESRFGIEEASVNFEFTTTADYGYEGMTSRKVFEISVSGTLPTGGRYWKSYEDEDAVTFLNEMFAWEDDHA